MKKIIIIIMFMLTLLSVSAGIFSDTVMKIGEDSILLSSIVGSYACGGTDKMSSFINGIYTCTADIDTTYSESDYYLTLSSEVFGINEANLNKTIIAITDERDTDTTIPDTDTNESVKVDKLIGTNCGGTDKMIGVNSTGGVECGSDIDTDIDTTYTNSSFNLGSIPGTITTAEVSNYTDTDTTYSCSDWSTCTDNSLWDANKLDGQLGSYYLDNTDTWRTTIDQSNVTNLNDTIIAITDARDTDTNTQLSEAQVEGMIFDIDNSGTMKTTGNLNASDFCINGGNCLSDAGVGSGDITSVNSAGKYLTSGSGTGDVSLLVNETELNATIILITDARDTDTDTTYTNSSWNLGSIPGSITTSEVSNYSDSDTTYSCSDWSACSDDSLWDADKLDGQDGSYYLDDTNTWRTTIDHSNVTNLNATIIVITDARDTDTTCDSDTCEVTNTGTLDGYEASALLDDTDTNESTRFGVLVGTDCPGTDKVVGINSTGGVLCTSDVDTTIADTDCDGETCEVTNTGTLDGYEASALLDDTDTNESTRFDKLANTDCSGTQKVIGVNATGGVLCSADIDTTIADTDTNESVKVDKLIGTNCGGTDKMIGVNATGGVECGADVNSGADGVGYILLNATVLQNESGSIGIVQSFFNANYYSTLNSLGFFNSYLNITLLKDLVAGDGLQGGADDVLVGTDADVTINIDVSDFAGAYVDGEDLAIDASGACAANKLCGGDHTHPASQVTTGSFGTGDYVFDGKVTVEWLLFENGGNITSNSTTMIMTGPGGSFGTIT